MVSGVPNLVHHRGINAVEHSRKNLPAGLHDDTEDGCGDRKAHDRIGQRVAEPDVECTSEHGEARPAIDARMIAGHQHGTADLAPDANAKDRDSLVAEETDHRGKRNRPQVMNILRMKETFDALVPGDDSVKRLFHPQDIHKTFDALVPGDDSAGKDGKEHRQPRQVLYTTISEGKTSAWLLAREEKGDAERNGSRGTAKLWIVSASNATLPEAATTMTWNSAVAISPMKDHFTAQSPRAELAIDGSMTPCLWP